MYSSWDGMQHNFFHFGSFFSISKIEKNISGNIILLHMSTINEDDMIHGSWNITCNTEFVVILGHFLLFDPPDYPENQIFEKMKKIPGDIIVLQMCIINENHMMYGSWDMEQDKQIFFHFVFHFFPFTPLTIHKIKIFKKWEKPWR